MRSMYNHSSQISYQHACPITTLHGDALPHYRDPLPHYIETLYHSTLYGDPTLHGEGIATVNFVPN